MKRFVLIAAACLISGAGSLFAQNLAGTFEVARKDTTTLYMDVYAPSDGSETTIDGLQKPTVMFVFGGGFISGHRSSKWYMPWFKILNDNGYRVVTVDYRLGLKGKKMRFDVFHLLDSAKKTKRAVDMGVEDIFSSVSYLIENGAAMGIDPDNLVISGSSAGAMISLSAELEICNRTERAGVLPEGFRFKGVMSFAGAIMSDSGMPRYMREPCPQLLIHGTRDGAVAYNKTAFLRRGIYGSSCLVAKVLKPKGYCYQIYRYHDHSHDMASNMVANWPEEKRFLENNVVRGIRCTIDSYVDDPAMPAFKAATLGTLY